MALSENHSLKRGARDTGLTGNIKASQWTETKQNKHEREEPQRMSQTPRSLGKGAGIGRNNEPVWNHHGQGDGIFIRVTEHLRHQSLSLNWCWKLTDGITRVKTGPWSPWSALLSEYQPCPASTTAASTDLPLYYARGGVVLAKPEKPPQTFNCRAIIGQNISDLAWVSFSGTLNSPMNFRPSIDVEPVESSKSLITKL